MRAGTDNTPVSRRLPLSGVQCAGITGGDDRAEVSPKVTGDVLVNTFHGIMRLVCGHTMLS